MPHRSHNKQLFALRQPPPEKITLGGIAYRLVRVFKHDFYAATCLYKSDDPAAEIPQAVVKLGRQQNFCGMPMKWMGKLLRNREAAIYKVITGTPGVPRFMGLVGETGMAIEYMNAKPLDHFDVPPAGYFERMRQILDTLHARGVAYCDANKRSNMLVGPNGEAVLIDFQISLRRRDDLPWPIRTIIGKAVDYVCDRDIYHLYKHKRRLCPQELTPEEEKLSRWRGLFHRMHRKLTKPYRAIRRRFLKEQYNKGQLISPTAQLEDHNQPEKATWRHENTAENNGD